MLLSWTTSLKNLSCCVEAHEIRMDSWRALRVPCHALRAHECPFHISSANEWYPTAFSQEISDFMDFLRWLFLTATLFFSATFGQNYSSKSTLSLNIVLPTIHKQMVRWKSPTVAWRLIFAVLFPVDQNSRQIGLRGQSIGLLPPSMPQLNSLHSRPYMVDLHESSFWGNLLI